jgi:adenine-specific DNA-methyltransferase
VARVSKARASPSETKAESYSHSGVQTPSRPEVGVSAQFKLRKPAQRYRYDDSLAPALEWDEENPAREKAEKLIRTILEAPDLQSAREAARQLQGMSAPFLNWAGKVERSQIEIPTLPLFIHEKLSTEAIIQTLKTHRKDRHQKTLTELFGLDERPIADQALRAYEYKDKWVNRLVLGDSLIVMNSLLQFEGLGGQVQTVYMDPPYGVKFGSNFQPFIRQKRHGSIEHDDDDSLTREPEMVKAYRDTWELGLHSYLAYLRDRLRISRDLLATSGSIFVQISSKNLHHVREILDEVFGPENFCGIIQIQKTSGQSSELLAAICDFILWYARDIDRVKYHQLYLKKPPIRSPNEIGVGVEKSDGEVVLLTKKQLAGEEPLPKGRLLRLRDTTSETGTPESRFPYKFQDKTFVPPGKRGWSTSLEGLDKLADGNRLYAFEDGTSLRWKFYYDEFPF